MTLFYLGLGLRISVIIKKINKRVNIKQSLILIVFLNDLGCLLHLVISGESRGQNKGS